MQTVSEKIQARKAERDIVPVSTSSLSDKLNQRRRERANIDEQFLGESRGGNDVKMGFTDRLVDSFTGESRKTEETKNTPELREVGLDIDAAKQISAGLLTTMNPQAQMDIIKDAIPEATFRQDKHNTIFIKLPDGQEAVLNKPGFSKQDGEELVAQALAYFPAAKIAGLGKTLLQKAGLGSVTALMTNLGLQKASQEYGSKQPIDKVEAGVAAAVGGAAEVVVPAVQGFRNLRRSRKHQIEADDFNASRVDALEAKEATEGLAKISPTGEKIGLTQPQQTLNPGQMTQARSVAETNAGGRLARRTLSEQNKQVNRAKDNVLNSIAPPEAVERGATSAQNAAQSAIDKAKAARDQAASPHYQTAFNSFEGEVPIKGVRGLIVSIRKEAANESQLKITMNRALKLLKGTTKEVGGKSVITPPTIKQLHNAKIEIGDMIEGTGGKPLSNTIKHELTRVQQKLTEVLKEASPDYKKAMEIFEEMSPEVDDLVNSTIGKVANKKELKNLGNVLFDSGEINRTILKRTKAEIRKVNPQAWDDMLRLHVEKRLSKMTTEIGEETMDNVPGKMYRALFGNDANTKILFEAASPEVKRNLVYFRTVLNRARKARPGGSDTSSKTAAKESRAVKRILDLLGSPIEALKGAGRSGAQDIVDAKIASMLFNTDFIPNFKTFMKLPSDSPASVRVLAQLLDDIELVDADS